MVSQRNYTQPIAEKRNNVVMYRLQQSHARLPGQPRPRRPRGVGRTVLVAEDGGRLTRSRPYRRLFQTTNDLTGELQWLGLPLSPQPLP